MKKIFLFLLATAPTILFAQDTITIQTETMGTFETITYEEVSYDTAFTENSYISNEGGTVAVFRNESASSERKTQKSLNEDITLSVQPNPSSGIFELVSNGMINRIDVYSIIGEALLSKEIREPYRASADLTSLSNGIYFLKVTFADGSSRSQRVVKQ
jgi:hypothetical protein